MLILWKRIGLRHFTRDLLKANLCLYTKTFTIVFKINISISVSSISAVNVSHEPFSHKLQTMSGKSGPDIVWGGSFTHVAHSGRLRESAAFSHGEKLHLITVRGGGACEERVGGMTWLSRGHIPTLPGLCARGPNMQLTQVMSRYVHSSSPRLTAATSSILCWNKPLLSTTTHLAPSAPTHLPKKALILMEKRCLLHSHCNH